METNALLLRRALSALGMTSAVLAQHITAIRNDGKETGLATISRWLNEVSAVEPAVLLYLRELLRAKVRNLAPEEVNWAETQSVVIGVANQKGGVGSSTIAAALSIILGNDLRQPTRHVQVGAHKDDCADPSLVKWVKSAGVDSDQILLDGAARFTVPASTYVVVDIHRSVAGHLPAAGLGGRPFDMVVVPADFGSTLEIDGTRRFIEALPPGVPHAFLHTPSLPGNLSFAKDALRQGFDVTGRDFVPFALPKTLDRFHAFSSTAPWASEDLRLLCARLFEHLMLRIDVPRVATLQQAVDSMEIPGLLAVLGA